MRGMVLRLVGAAAGCRECEERVARQFLAIEPVNDTRRVEVESFEVLARA